MDPRQQRSVPRQCRAAGLGVLIGLGIAGGLWTAWVRWRPGRDSRAPVALETPYANGQPGVAFVGDEACARCHRELAADYRRHPMGRSLTHIAGVPAAAGTSPDKVTTFDAGSSHFTVEQREGRMFHRESRSDEQGRLLAQVEAEVSYALGSGGRGISYLVEREGRLYQSPISWYSQKHRWDLSPGYERRNHHFNRPIEPQCLFCHSNRVQPVPMSVNRYEEPIFRGLAIGCERCHGPGELHVRGQQVVDGKDLTIVNPRYLEPPLRAAVCEQCHLLGEHRIDRLGRGPFDFRPGLPTTDFFAVYDRSGRPASKAVGHVEQMKLSRCYQASSGQLGCISCHDPHRVPTPGERVAYFRRKCQECHEQPGCSLPLAQRLARSIDDNCFSCHMPTSTSSDIAHIAITDHRILKTPDSQTADQAVPAREDSPLRLLNGNDLGADKFESRGRELGIALTFEGEGLPFTPQVRQLGLIALDLLDKALFRRPDDLEARRMRARALAIAGRHREAISLQQQILKVAPSYEQVLDEFVQYSIELREFRKALAAAAEAVAINPSSPGLHERLAFLYSQTKDWDGVMRESRQSVRLDPFRRFARMFLIESLLHGNDVAGAEAELATLVGLNPNERAGLERWFAEKRKNL
jgi:Tetratricopeptide repeat